MCIFIISFKEGYFLIKIYVDVVPDKNWINDILRSHSWPNKIVKETKYFSIWLCRNMQPNNLR